MAIDPHQYYLFPVMKDPVRVYVNSLYQLEKHERQTTVSRQKAIIYKLRKSETCEL